MGLEIRHNRAENLHENLQFRRIAIGLNKLFFQKGWDGLLIGNPESEDFSRFRADAILLYNHGLIIIDFKDYQGLINLPEIDDDFKTKKWHIETEKDKSRLEVKGASFSNPFIQLKSYRQVMYEIIQNSIALNANIDPSRVGAINLFSGPIQLNRQTPRSVPYYAITQESDFFNFLYDYNSPNTFSQESASALKRTFPAEIWQEQIEIVDVQIPEKRVYSIDDNLEVEIKSFFETEESEILILESMDVSQRDEWVNYILGEVGKYAIPQAETWTHSARIREKIKKRSGLVSHSLYKTIYGGPAKIKEAQVSEDEVEAEEIDVENQVIVPVKTDISLDEKALIILHEAHLVTRSLNQSDLLRFGSGRLLEDLLFHLSLGETKRKLVCIGDPFSLSYGKEDESAIVIKTLTELWDGKIRRYRQAPKEVATKGIRKLRTDLALSVNDKTFNELKYHWKENNLVAVDKPEVLNLLKEWFGNVFNHEPNKTVLFYKNDDAKNTNLWVKDNCLKNSKELSKGDLLLLSNNVTIIDKTGFGEITRLYNGMYVTIEEILEEYSKAFYFGKKNQSATLDFVRIRVKCLSIENKPETEVWLYKNYLDGNGKLSKDEEIAFKILTNEIISKRKEDNPFESSPEYIQMNQDNTLSLIKKEIQEYQIKFDKGERVKTKLEELERGRRKAERKYYKKYQLNIVLQATKSDPLLNAITANYGWCTTVHKSIGSQYDEVIINAKQGETNGITNESYFRWLYTGASSSKINLFVFNPEQITPLKYCEFEDLGGDNWIEDNTPPRKRFTIENFQINKSFENKIDSGLCENAKAAISIFSEYVENFGFILEKTFRSGNFLSKAFFSTPDNFSLVMAFSNNAQGIISSIRPERTNDAISDIIEKGISHVWSYSNISSEPKNLPVDFRKKIYERWMNHCETVGGDLRLVESHDYQDVFCYKSDVGKIKFKVYYDGKGFFTKIIVQNKIGNEISNNLKNLLYHGE